MSDKRSTRREQSEIRLGIIIISDRATTGERPDETIPLVKSWCAGKSMVLALSLTVPDDHSAIRTALEQAVRKAGLDLVITSGGTGLSERDITPEITRAFIEKATPGIDEFLRAMGRRKTPFAVLSRGISGMAGNCLVVNMPGNPQAVIDNLEWLHPIISHALGVSRGPVADSEHQVK